MDLKYDDMDHPIQFHALVEAEILKKIDKDPDKTEKINSEIRKTSLKPGANLQRTLVSFSYAERPLEGFDYANTLVEVDLPYCLHFPNHSEFEINLIENNIKSLVTLKKIWTYKAQSEEGKSDETDFYTDDQTLYFQKSTILGPRVPSDEAEGWDTNITGKNLEKVNDQNGVFRYTKLYIQLEIDLPNNLEKLTDKQQNRILSEIEEKSLLVVNRLIDNYREITNEMHVRRLGEIKINLVYFTKMNTGFYLSNLNVATAIMNRSRAELKQLDSKLSSGGKPELYKLLLLNAKDSMRNKDFTLAIVESFQALEIFIENYLINEYKNKGKTESAYRSILDENLRTKDRLNKLLKDVKGVSLNEKSEMWNPWCNRYDKTRNEVVHLGKEPTQTETRETLEINEKVIDWILSL